MKYILTVITLVIACTMSTKVIGQNIQLEVIAAPTLTSLYGSKPASEYNPAINFSAGVGASYKIHKSSYLSARLLFEKKGAKTDAVEVNIGNDVYKYDGRMNLSYITLPVQWQEEFGNKIHFRIGAGVYGAYMVHQNYKFDAQGDYSIAGLKNHTEVSNIDTYNRFDFGISASASTYIPLNESLQLLIGINDNFGLLEILKSSDAYTAKVNSLALTTGLSIKI